MEVSAKVVMVSGATEVCDLMVGLFMIFCAFLHNDICPVKLPVSLSALVQRKEEREGKKSHDFSIFLLLAAIKCKGFVVFQFYPQTLNFITLSLSRYHLKAELLKFLFVHCIKTVSCCLSWFSLNVN